MASHPMTLEGKRLLDEELNRLIKVEREAVKLAIAEARAHGDLKENAEYSAAKEKQSMIEGRIAEIQGKIGSANVIDVSKINDTKVVFGATVTIYNAAKDESTIIQIVGEDEAQTDKSKISFSSPLGRALIGKEEGDEVVVKAPKGDIEYEIERIRYI